MAFCENCGQSISDQAAACPKCGHPQRPTFAAGAAALRRTEGTAIASLILGVGGLVLCPLILSILAIIFGNQAKAKIAADPSLEGEGLAKAGVVLGWVGVGFAVIGGLIFILFFAAASSSSGF